MERTGVYLYGDFEFVEISVIIYCAGTENGWLSHLIGWFYKKCEVECEHSGQSTEES